MTKRRLSESELEVLFDSQGEKKADFLENEGNTMGCKSSSSDSEESIEIMSENSTDISDSENEFPTSSTAWGPVTGSTNAFTKTSNNVGVSDNVTKKLSGKDPIDFYNYFLREVIPLIVTETNRYALQNSKIQPWTPTDTVEMRKFIGIILWMGLVRLPEIQDYWSMDVLYENNISKCMDRSRFEQLLRNIHFCNNMNRDKNNRLYKISAILDIINKKFQEAYVPGDEVCIDESNVPFCEHIYFRRYISKKLHRYGIKLCATGGYTWRYKVCTRNEKGDGGSVGEKAVMELMNGLLDSGRTLYTDNSYTSVSLGKKLISRDTHLVGTLHANRKNIPREVIDKKLLKGEIISRQNQDKIVVLKWKGKRNVLMLSTKHDDSMISLTINGKEVSKPAMVIDYNKGKAFVDVSDQMVRPYLQKSIKWYKRLVFHLITATTVVNAHYLYNIVNSKKMELTQFREFIIKAMTTVDSSEPIPMLSTSTKHILKEVEGMKRKTRRRCILCYRQLSLEKGSSYARKNAKKVNTRCENCKTPICIDCFQKYHQTGS